MSVPFKRLRNYPDKPVSQKFYTSVNDNLSKFPEFILLLLEIHDYWIVLPRLFTDYYKSMAGKPMDSESWDSDKTGTKTYDQLRGAHDKSIRVITIPEFRKKCTDKDASERLERKKEYEIFETLCHEIGHAIDAIPSFYDNTHFSDFAEYKIAYHKDRRKLTESEKRKLKFNINGSVDSRREVFAECFSQILFPNKYIGRSHAGFRADNFPHVSQFLQEIIEELESLGHIKDL